MLLTTPYSKLAARYICAVGLLICFAQYTWASPAPVDLNIVAHQDDDILFMNPDILYQVVAGHRQVTVYITAGNIGRSDDVLGLPPGDPAYPLAREAGAIAGYHGNFWWRFQVSCRLFSFSLSLRHLFCRHTAQQRINNSGDRKLGEENANHRLA
jgi:hypothetical protein